MYMVEDSTEKDHLHQMVQLNYYHLKNRLMKMVEMVKMEMEVVELKKDFEKNHLQLNYTMVVWVAGSCILYFLENFQTIHSR